MSCLEHYQRFTKSVRNTENDASMLDDISTSSTYGEFRLKMDLYCFDKDRFDKDRFIVILGYSLAGSDDNYKTIEFLLKLSEESDCFKEIFESKTFWSICGKWIRHNYSKKDKRKMIYLIRLMNKASDYYMKKWHK